MNTTLTSSAVMSDVLTFDAPVLKALCLSAGKPNRRSRTRSAVYFQDSAAVVRGDTECGVIYEHVDHSRAAWAIEGAALLKVLTALKAKGPIELAWAPDGSVTVLGVTLSGWIVPGDEIPTLHDLRPPIVNLTATLDLEPMVKELQSVAYAAAREPGRYAMHGILVDLVHAKACGTDGQRLAFSPSALAVALEPAFHVDTGGISVRNPIVPVSALRPLAAWAPLLGDCHATIHGGGLLFESQDAMIRVYVRTIDGDFPYYREILPQEPERLRFYNLDIPRLTAAAKIAKLQSKAAPVIVLDVTDGHLFLVGEAASVGRCGIADHRDVRLAMNPCYMLDALAAGGRELGLRLSDGATKKTIEHPMTWYGGRHCPQWQDDIVQVLMPIKLEK